MKRQTTNHSLAKFVNIKNTYTYRIALEIKDNDDEIFYFDKDKGMFDMCTVGELTLFTDNGTVREVEEQLLNSNSYEHYHSKNNDFDTTLHSYLYENCDHTNEWVATAIDLKVTERLAERLGFSK